MGPAKSGKSALVNVIGDRLQGSGAVSGSIAYNGKSLKDSRVVPTFLCATDEPLANVTVEQALIYTGEFCTSQKSWILSKAVALWSG